MFGEEVLPDKQFKRVVFPEPEGPIIAVIYSGLRIPFILLIMIFFSFLRLASIVRFSHESST
jgi:hypothetical protein